MLTDDRLRELAALPDGYATEREMARELLARRKLDRAEIAATNAELAGRDTHDEWAAVLQARSELDEATR